MTDDSLHTVDEHWFIDRPQTGRLHGIEGGHDA